MLQDPDLDVFGSRGLKEHPCDRVLCAESLAAPYQLFDALGRRACCIVMSNQQHHLKLLVGCRVCFAGLHQIFTLEKGVRGRA